MTEHGRVRSDRPAARELRAAAAAGRGRLSAPVRRRRPRSARWWRPTARATGAELEAQGVQVRVAGRILGMRTFGKANFLVLSDGKARVQAYVRQDSVPELDFSVFRLLDFGDWVGVAGRMFRTKTNELTVWASSLTFLAKCFLPLPEKWHGLTDVETRYRQRYLDLAVNPDSRRVFETRSRVVATTAQLPDGARVSRGRDADDAVDCRRRAGAAVRHASQRARHPALHAHRAGALPEAAHGRAASNACSRSTVTSGTRGSPRSTTPSSRCSSSTGATPTTTT